MDNPRAAVPNEPGYRSVSLGRPPHSELHSGHAADALPKATYNKYICQKKEKLEYISVSSVQPSTHNLQVNPFPVYNKASEDKMLHNAR